MSRSRNRRERQPVSVLCIPVFSLGSRVAGFILITLGLSTCTLAITCPTVPPPDSWDSALNTHPEGAELQDLIDRFSHEGLPGVVLLVRTPRGLWNGSAGYARVEDSETMTPTHRHHAASVTKMYMAAAALLLVEDGLIDLDARMSEYLPEDIWRPVPNGSEATVRQLLGHRSGIPDFSGNMTYDLTFLNDPAGLHPPGRMLSYIHGLNPIFSPGEGYFYSNANYFLLALIVDEVTGAGHADVISERILRPLGLSATYYKNEVGYPRPPGLVNSYQDLAGDGRLMNVSDLATYALGNSYGNAGLVATSADFAAFIEGLLDGAVVEEAMLAEMLERPGTSRYGLGLSFMETPFGWAVGHSGGDMGVLSQVRRFPSLDATLVLLSNGGNGGVPDQLFDSLWEEAMELSLGGR